MKTIGIMQPYFFPYLGYFDLIYNVDHWIVFDTPQYIRHGWVNRNRILHPNQGWQYILIPLQKHHRETVIKDILIRNDSDWRGGIIRQLEHYKKKAPFYKDTHSFIEGCLAKEENSLSKMNIHIMEKVCSLLEISFHYSIFSEMNLEIGPVHGPGDWALRICESMGAGAYINPPGGRDLFDIQAFQEKGIKLIIREFENMVYSCEPYQFEPALSIIDVLMWNSPKTIRDYLESKRIR